MEGESSHVHGLEDSPRRRRQLFPAWCVVCMRIPSNPSQVLRRHQLSFSPYGRAKAFEEIKILSKRNKREEAANLTVSYNVAEIATCGIGRRTDRHSKGRAWTAQEWTRAKTAYWSSQRSRTHSVEKGQSFPHTVSWGNELSVWARDKTNSDINLDLALGGTFH